MRSSPAPPVPDVRGSLTLSETAMTLAGCIRELTSRKTGIYKDGEMLRLLPTYLWLKSAGYRVWARCAKSHFEGN